MVELEIEIERNFVKTTVIIGDLDKIAVSQYRVGVLKLIQD